MVVNLRSLWLEHTQECLTPAEAIEHGLTKWASDPSELSRAEREAWLAGFSANVAIEQTLAKLASEGSLPPEEIQFLQALHAEAGLRDLQQLTKTALSPTAWGTIGGAVLGGGLGAMKDDENRLRGAALGAIPGAAIGALAGHGWGTWRQNQITAQGNAARQAVDDALAKERLATQREVAQRAADAHAAKGKADDLTKRMNEAAGDRWHRSALAAADDIWQEYYHQFQTAPTPELEAMLGHVGDLRNHIAKNREGIIKARIDRPKDPVLMTEPIPGYDKPIMGELQARAKHLFDTMA